MSNLANLDNATFRKEVLESDIPVLVDFTAHWCGPCQQLVPVIEALADEYEGRLTVAQIDMDDNQDIASQFEVQNLPSLLLFKQGKEVDRLIGMKSKDTLVKWIESHL